MPKLAPALLPSVLWSLVLGSLGACSVAPTRPIPDPLPEVLEWAREAQEGGEAYLGLEVRENDSGSLEALAFEPGVRITSVAPDSPAALAGFAIGDVLLAWDDVSVDDPGTLDALLSDGPATPTLRVRRGDSVFELEVELRATAAGSAEPARLVWRSDPARSRAGWLAGRDGVVLVTSDPGGPFVDAGVEVGSVVTAIDGEAVRSERALIRELQARDPGAKVEIDFVDAAGEPRTKKVKLYAAPSRVTEATLPVVAGYRSSVDGSETSFYLIDLWFISLFKYRREGKERHWSFLRFFTFSRGVGVLTE